MSRIHSLLERSDPQVIRFRRSRRMVFTQVLGAAALLSMAVARFLATGSPAVAGIWGLAAAYILMDGWWHHVTPLVEIDREKVTIHQHYLRAVEVLMLSEIAFMQVQGRELVLSIKTRPAPIRIRLDRAAEPNSLIKFFTSENERRR